ncbi:N-acetylneuraminate synthase family protein [Candidatus Symbiobacter mobilis]|uniref:N-acetylneuraminate synthase n=1 Tax=Candidatus Symbiobacter mobilis CR TaxID=946483 RepID=U5N774_9BURK|nr:N-acetylneuraminate synthase family protein [Candidatus Symbiobacter mobilis]AGX86148.1 N-acetylneuraminate synthase [Candidatus Symbiobacter mobilis CR]
MIIEKSFGKLVVFKEDSLLNALNKINSNKSRVVFVVSENGALEGALTDGDFRRWITSSLDVNLDVPVSRVMNSRIQWANVDAPARHIQAMLNSRVVAVPLVDAHMRLAAVALHVLREMDLDGRMLSEHAPAFLIAEIGNNHNGSLERALALVDAAVEAGADCAKFQMRDLKSLYRNAGNSNDDSSDLGDQYTLDLLSRFQLTDEELFTAFDHCRQKGILPLCTPWDHASLRKLESYGLPAYKIASADFTNFDLIDAIAATGKPMICSTGMSSEKEINEGVRHLQAIGAQFVLLHCNSTYPAPFKDVNLSYMQHLRELSEGLVGYSGHERGIHVVMAAIALGAKVIEKHFTLDKSLEGNDHKISLLPHEFSEMVTGVRQIEEALGHFGDRTVSQGEMINRETLAKSLTAAQDIPAGSCITEEMITVRSPGHGLQPNRKMDLIGVVLRRDKKAGDYFYPSDLGEGQVIVRNYDFGERSWGIPVRYHDLQQMSSLSNPTLLEIHLSYKDMALDFRKYFSEALDLELVVHAPELFAGDHTLDLCSPDSDYLDRSIRELQRVIVLTRELTPFFKRTSKPCIVVNVGGFSKNRHLNADECSVMYSRLIVSLSKLDCDGVEVIPQTMPPFPWHFGGQQFHNLFVDAESIVDFCKKSGMRVCLDLSHSKLACNHLKYSFARFLEQVLPYSAHLHIADAAGVDGEGLQIGDGDIDWKEFWILFGHHAHASVTFIPEIWQGHKNDGAGAWRALERLESIAKAVKANRDAVAGMILIR